MTSRLEAVLACVFLPIYSGLTSWLNTYIPHTNFIISVDIFIILNLEDFIPYSESAKDSFISAKTVKNTSVLGNSTHWGCGPAPRPLLIKVMRRGLFPANAPARTCPKDASNPLVIKSICISCQTQLSPKCAPLHPESGNLRCHQGGKGKNNAVERTANEKHIGAHAAHPQRRAHVYQHVCPVQRFAPVYLCQLSQRF